MLPAKFAPNLWSQGHLKRENTIITSCLRLIWTLDNFIHPFYVIYKVFASLVWCLKGIRVRPYTVTPAKLAPDLVIIDPLWTVKMMPLHHSWDWYPPQTATHILIRHKQSVLVIDMLSQGNMGAPLYHYTGQVGPRFVKSGSLVEWKKCQYLMAEADINLGPFHTSILSIYKGFEQLACCLKGMWVHP